MKLQWLLLQKDYHKDLQTEIVGKGRVVSTDVLEIWRAKKASEIVSQVGVGSGNVGRENEERTGRLHVCNSSQSNIILFSVCDTYSTVKKSQTVSVFMLMKSVKGCQFSHFRISPKVTLVFTTIIQYSHVFFDSPTPSLTNQYHISYFGYIS